MPVFLALLVTAIMAITGLAVDFGFAAMERRHLQNAADAAAISGAINLVRGESPVSDVATVANRNAVTSAVECSYVDASNAVTGACSATAGGTSDGVKVIATNARPTFFLNVVGIRTLTVSAESIARVSAWTNTTPYEVGNSLFVVCGYGTKLRDPQPTDPPTGRLSILQGTQPGASPWNVNPAAFNREFVIHDPHVADCGMASERFKGLNASSGVITLPATLLSETGDRAGPTRTAVNGIAGCPAGLDTEISNDCVMVIPIFVSSPAKDYVYAVRWLPFRVREIDANTHVGRLLENYTIREDTNTLLAPWTKTMKGVITSVRTVR